MSENFVHKTGRGSNMVGDVLIYSHTQRNKYLHILLTTTNPTCKISLLYLCVDQSPKDAS